MESVTPTTKTPVMVSLIVEPHDRACWEEKIAFDGQGVAYDMIRVVGGGIDGVICLFIEGTTCWIGRLWGLRVATYQMFAIMKLFARTRGCLNMVGQHCPEGEPFYRAARFTRTDNVWIRGL